MEQSSHIEPTKLPGVYLVRRPVNEDERGFFREVFRKEDLEAQLGFEFKPVQWNQSQSKRDTLRGIHIAPWHKLVTVTAGTAQQVVVDARADSPTFGQHVSETLGEGQWGAMFIPAGCGNAFLATSEVTDYLYLVTDYWAPGKEQSILYNDPDLNIIWQSKAPVLSAKDLQNPTWRQSFPEKFN
jgi:dTDP-4-dehydrorhamnose 3,5-epimerase